MKRDFTQDDFERFLKKNAEDLRLGPTPDLWGRIERRLNRRRRWMLLSSAFFLLTASLFGYVIIDRSTAASDPFASVQTVTKKTGGENKLTDETTTATAITTEAPAPLTIGTKSNPVVTSLKPVAASVIKNQTSSAKPENRSKLFQTPMPVRSETAAAGATTEPFAPIPSDEYEPAAAGPATEPLKQQRLAADPLTIESVLNSYKPKWAKRKPEFQLFFTPTISYRRLTENKSYLRAVPQNMASFNLAALYDVNSMVTHKPDLGLELGFAFRLPVTSRIRLRTGMQFNVTRYDIKAFTYVPERATIALNNRHRGVDSVNTVSSYRNFNNGGRADWLQNLYFQVSAPIGVEVALSNAKKTQFNVAGSIQPTYLLGDRAYLISSDYKNYSQVPWLIRRWNMNTSLEAFVSHTAGKVRWQVGPQVRYQLLSSFVEKYPVKENLFDFGMKVGVSFLKK